MEKKVIKKQRRIEKRKKKKVEESFVGGMKKMIKFMRILKRKIEN
jgi:hypothetical protein